MLTISVKNFGPIAEGSVDLKPLTIFVGPSNTGKSYMATAVYAVMDTNTGYFSNSRPDDFPLLRPSRIGRAIGNPSEIPESLTVWARHYTRKDRSELTVADLPKDAQFWLEGLVSGSLESYCRDVLGRLHQIHGGEPGFLRRGNEPGNFLLATHRDDPALKLVFHRPGAPNPSPEFSIAQATITEDVFIPVSIFGFTTDEEEDTEVNIAAVAHRMANVVAESIFAGLPPRSYYLPAARSGIAQGHKVLSAALVRQSSFVGLQEMHIPTLPAITTEFLSYLIRLDRRMAGQRNSSEGLQEAIAFIETAVLQGQVELDESGGLPYPEIVYLPVVSGTPSEKFTLEHTSSMVSELAPLILFLKYLVRPGHLLILEEPESHLHPAAQRQLARGIVRLVNAGVKVLITTHSDIIISQVNNLLALNQASPELIAKGGFEPEDFLREDQVGAYLFRYNRELAGSEVVPLEIDPDTGIDEDEFATVFEAIYDESIALQRDRN